MSDPHASDENATRLRALDARIAQIKAAERKPNAVADGHSQGQLAWRMVIELVAGLGIGFGIGYGLDQLLGTIPIFLVLFTLLGFAAGVKTVIRSAQEVQEKQLARAAGKDGDD